MKKEIITRLKELFKDGRIDAVVGQRKMGDQVAPYLFTSSAELGSLVTGDEESPGGVRYSLFRLLSDLQRNYPNKTFALMVRGCEERALRARLADGRVSSLNPHRIETIGYSCPSELAAICECLKPWPDALVAGERTEGFKSIQTFPTDLIEDLTKWLGISDRCIKCFGCRNACPVCGCQECTVEREALVPQRQLPPTDSFLMTRAVHMVDRCVLCGLCERACPSGIPLRQLYRLVSSMVGQRGGLYEPGNALSESNSTIFTKGL
jgi:ferredoxin